MAEDRENEERTLGELPEDIFKIKGEKYPESQDYFPGAIPADIASSAPIANSPSVNEDRSQGASVRSTYDTRPINATDFHFTETQEVNPVLESDVIALFTYTVPDSYVAVLREFEYRQTPLIDVEDLTPKVSILINGITQVGHSNIEFTSDQTPQKTHIIAPEKSELTIRIIYPAGYSIGVALSVWVHLYGNLILTKNRPAAFEVGNETPIKTIPVPASLNQEMPVKAVIPSQQMPVRKALEKPKRQMPKFSVRPTRRRR